MAEVTVDKVCEKLETYRQCRTHQEELPTEDRRSKTGSHRYHHLGQRLARIEQEKSYGQLICECELATREGIETAIIKGGAKTLDDVRRDERLGMGPCQGGFCTFRAAGIWHLAMDQQSTVEETNTALRDFLQERWKGLSPILWGKQLRQERLNELIYLNVLNVDHLPGEGESRLGSENYLDPDKRQETEDRRPQSATSRPPSAVHRPPSIDSIIIGGGFAGLTAAWQLASRGQKVHVIAKGWGATHWASGCIDVLGYYPIDNIKPVEAPVSAIARMTMEQPDHPYAHLSLKQIDSALKSFQKLCTDTGYPIQGSLDTNWLLPTAAGGLRSTCLAPETMTAGDLHDPAPMLLVGIEGYHDFYPHFAAANLRAQGISTEAAIIRLPSLQSHHQIDTLTLTQYFDEPESVHEVAEALRPLLGKSERIGFPAVLGRQNALDIVKILESLFGRRVFEIPGLPPSVPGMRLHQILVKAIREAGGRVSEGMEVVNAERTVDSSQIKVVFTEAAARSVPHSAQNFVLATGGILGGGIYTNHTGAVYDPIFNLSIQSPATQQDWLDREFLHPKGHPIFQAGVRVDHNFCTEIDNVYAIGNSLAGDFVRERSLEGVALVSSYRIAEVLP
jgi:glycerol-3-phosphate dehydrogenase subunit B